jgi:hypothetical protein
MNYRYALRRLEREYPNFKFSGVSTDSTAVATEKSTLPCPCGQGRIGIWPWQLQHAELGFCGNPECDVLHRVRNQWAEEGLGNDVCWLDGGAMRPEVLFQVHTRVHNYRFRQSRAASRAALRATFGRMTTRKADV